jgi:ATP-dependent helicase HrpA
VILRAKSLGLGDIENFPFLDPPARAPSPTASAASRAERGGRSQAADPVGHELARLPLDPRVARMLVAARDEGCLDQC